MSVAPWSAAACYRFYKRNLLRWQHPPRSKLLRPQSASKLAHSKVLLLLLLNILRLRAQEDADLWMRARSGRGRVEVVAMEAAQAQQLAFWAERSLKQLESDWGKTIPFQTKYPLRMRIEPQASNVRLSQEWEVGVLRQTIVLSPFSMQQSPEQVAVTFTQAMATRLGLAALPGSQKNIQWEVPDWLVVGSSHALLSTQSRALIEWAVLHEGSYLRYPEELARQKTLPSTVAAHANAALVCRWLFKKNPPNVWKTVAQADFRDAETWLSLFPNLGTVRKLHIEWDLWLQTERPKLIAEYGIDRAARQRLEEELRFIPAFYGWSVEDLNRYRPISFAALEAYLDDPRFEAGIHQWKLRLQEIRFRQTPEMNAQVDTYQRAANLAIQASKTKGRKRERLWSQAVEVFSQANEQVSPL